MPLGDTHQSRSAHSYLPVMIGRLMLSLKKAVDTSEVEWSLTGTTHTSNPRERTLKRLRGMQFAPVSDEGVASPAEADIPLATVLSPIH